MSLLRTIRRAIQRRRDTAVKFHNIEDALKRIYPTNSYAEAVKSHLNAQITYTIPSDGTNPEIKVYRDGVGSAYIVTSTAMPKDSIMIGPQAIVNLDYGAAPPAFYEYPPQNISTAPSAGLLPSPKGGGLAALAGYYPTPMPMAGRMITNLTDDAIAGRAVPHCQCGHVEMEHPMGTCAFGWDVDAGQKGCMCESYVENA